MNTQSSAEKPRFLDKKIQVYYKAKLYVNVEYYVDKALKYAPKNFKYLLLKAESLASLGRFHDALKIAINLIELDSNSAEAFYVRGLSRYLSTNVKDAVGDFERALQLDPDQSKWKELHEKSYMLHKWIQVGQRVYRRRCYRLARNAYTEALKIDMSHRRLNSKLLYNRALANWRLGLVIEAIDDCTTVLEYSTDFLKALQLRGRCYHDLARYKECIRDYEAALRVESTPEINKFLREAKLAMQIASPKDYYKILAISHSANATEIKKAYRKKALLHHPDKYSNLSAEKRRTEEAKFKEVGEAYAVLSDESKKRSYDVLLGKREG